MKHDEFVQIFADCDVPILKLLTYQALVMLLRSGRGSVEDFQLLETLENDLGKQGLLQAA